MNKKIPIRWRLTYGLIAAVAITVVTFGLWSTERLEWVFAPKLHPDIHGVWEEQGVAPYAADRFEIRPAGIFIDGRQATSQYQWDGQKLEYRLGDELYTYSYAANQFVRLQPAHYISSFSRQQVDLRRQ